MQLAAGTPCRLNTSGCPEAHQAVCGWHPQCTDGMPSLHADAVARNNSQECRATYGHTTCMYIRQASTCQMRLNPYARASFKHPSSLSTTGQARIVYDTSNKTWLQWVGWGTVFSHSNHLTPPLQPPGGCFSYLNIQTKPHMQTADKELQKELHTTRYARADTFSFVGCAATLHLPLGR